jgi:hypothetical protein
MAANGGELTAHYQVPLIDDDMVFMEFKSGSYNKNRYATQTPARLVSGGRMGSLR